MKDKFMKFIKPGKWEAATPATKKMKNALLRTYFVSLLCLVLCCTMFFGTTMAWFTDDVTNKGNVISVGTMKVKLLHLVTPDDTVDLGDSSNYDHQVFGSDSATVKWFGGHSESATLQVGNAGDLPFKYTLSLVLPTDSILQVVEVLDGEEYVEKKLADFFTVIVSKVTTDETGESRVVEVEYSLTELLTEKPLCTGTLYPESVITETNKNEVFASETYDITIQLAANASAEIMGQELQFNIHLVANQLEDPTVKNSENTSADESADG